MTRTAQSSSASPTSSSTSKISSLPLNSPSSQFIGTPFTSPSSASSPFEYPFPKDTTPNSIGSSSNSSPNSYRGPGGLNLSDPPFPSLNTNASTSTSTSTNALALSILTSRATATATKPQSNGITQESRSRIHPPGPQAASEIEHALQVGLGLRPSSVPVPPSLIEKAQRRGTTLDGLNFR